MIGVVSTVFAAVCFSGGPPSKAPVAPKVSARVAVVVDLDSGEILYDKAADESHAIASITKLVALRVIARANLDLSGATTMIKGDYEHTAGGSRSRLMTGRVYRNVDLLHAALLGSDNRAVVALGRSVGLSFAKLTAAMNREVRRLGLRDTSFVDPTGIDHANVSTGREVAAILAAALGRTELTEVSRKRLWKASARERKGIQLVYRNTNILVHDEDRKVLVGKTGFNSAAGWCVATAVLLPSGRRIAIVVLGTSGKYIRFRAARRLETWAAGLPWSPPPPTDNKTDEPGEKKPPGQEKP